MTGTEIHANSKNDLKEYLGDKYNEPKDVANSFSNEWKKKNPKTISEIEKMYIESDNYLYALAEYNTWPHRKSFYTYIKNMLNRHGVIDNIHVFSDGICSDSIAFSLDGFKVSASDLPSKYYTFGRWRMKKYGVKIPSYYTQDIIDGNKRFNAMIFVTVLEHIPNLLNFLGKISTMTNIIIEKSAFTAQIQQGLVVPGYTDTTRYQFYEWMKEHGYKQIYKLNAYSPNFWERKKI